MNSHTPSRVTVRIPGSTSNCGSGFDSLGLALQVYNRVTLTVRDDGRAVAERDCDARAADMIAATVSAMARRVPGVARFGFTYRIEGDVPPARGLGSSITVIGGVLMGLNVLARANLDREVLVSIANELEGHPDNAAAGILGGFCVARCDPADGRYLGTVRVALPSELRFVVVSPSVEMLTKEARGVLPTTLPYFDAVKSINASNYLVAALATGDYERLRDAVCDYMHEPYRLPRIKGGREAIAAGVAAGAYTGWLSGSGSSVLCVAPQAKACAVSKAMQAAFAQVGIPSEVRDLAADNVGCRVE